VGADAGTLPQVNVYDAATGQLRFGFFAFGLGFRGGVRVAVGDVNGDGVPDVIVGAGPGGGPQVRVFDGSTGQPLAGVLGSFYGMIPSRFTGGVFVAAGDVNGDGFADVIVGADAGGGPAVCVWSGKDGSLLNSFYALPSGFTGGVRVGAGDVNGDSKADVIAGAGPGALPQVSVFSGAGLAVLQSFWAFPTSFRGGVYVAGDSFGHIVVGAGPGGLPQVTIFDGRTGAVLQNFFVPATPAPSILNVDGSSQGGVRVGDLAVNGKNEIVTGLGPGAPAPIDLFDGNTLALLDRFFAFGPTFAGGSFVGG
jgi:hypothetical protein